MKLKLVQSKELRYLVPITGEKMEKRFAETEILIKQVDGEYQYIPALSEQTRTRLSSDELEMIVVELKKLNKEVK